MKKTDGILAKARLYLILFTLFGSSDIWSDKPKAEV